MENISENPVKALSHKEAGEIFRRLYKSSFPAVRGYIVKNNGSSEDAEDIFQEAMIIISGKFNDNGFKLSSSLNTYLFSVCRNLWLHKLRERRSLSLVNFHEYEPADFPESESGEYSDNSDRIHRWMSKITMHCQEVLRSVYLLQENMNSLMLKMGWKNRHTADNQKYKCLRQLRNESRKE
jgi:RNA polymerase sigma factor (sigma-70 family)